MTNSPARSAAVDRLFADPDALGRTRALVVMRQGQVEIERYAPDTSANTTLPSWSMAKSILHAAVGIAGMDPASIVAAPEWSSQDDPITLDDLLRMRSGLDWNEDYEPGTGSDVIEMLFGGHVEDMGGFTAAKPRSARPGARFLYSSGTSNIVARALGEHLGLRGPELAAWLHDHLFSPVSMTSAIPKFDGAGTWIASSYCFCTARDFARFGEMYRRDGVVGDRRVLPEGWVEHARRLTEVSVGVETRPYGAHWWLNDDGRGTFAASGYAGQHLWIVPATDLVVVRLGESTEEQRDALLDAVDAVVASYD